MLASPIPKLYVRNRDPFPLSALLILFVNSNKADTATDYFEGFMELVEWLSPIAIPDHQPCYIPQLHRNPNLVYLAKILKVPEYVIYKEYIDAVLIHEVSDHGIPNPRLTILST